MRFWRFDFDSEAVVDECIADSTILPPGKLPPTAKNKPSDIIQNKLKPGDGVLLASFDRMRDIGNVIAIGIVTEKKGVINWRRMNFSLTPSPGLGVAFWKKEACFKFADDPAKRYRLQSRFDKAFGDELLDL